MRKNVAYSIGNLALIDKADAQLNGYLNKVFKGAGGKVKDFVNIVKLLIYNNLGDNLATSRLLHHPDELFETMGFEDIPKERQLFRVIERVGKAFPIILEQHQKILKRFNLVTDKQYMDFSSTYFEGRADTLGDYGYSRDNQPNKKQITFGVSIGINGIPSALTIQKGNVSDKTHFQFMLRASEAVLEPGSLLIFDCGANTRDNKRTIRKKGFHYLTLKPKKVGKPYQTALRHYWASEKYHFELNGRDYSCVKRKIGEEIEYIFFSEKLEKEQLSIKHQKNLKRIEKNEPLLNRTKRGKPLGQYYCNEGIIVARGSLQRIFGDIPNPLINGLEGFFILQSSVDTDPKLILSLYKDRDKAEKLIRNMKEGTELRPIRHWNKWCIKGYVLLVFLTNFLLNLTLLRTPNPLLKNGKLLTKYLKNLTGGVVTLPWRARYRFLANETPEIHAILGDFIQRYEDRSIQMRW
jgi:transposase